MSEDRQTLLITMAGIGQRFRNAGFTVPKYQIEAHGHSLFYWAVLSLRHFITPQSQCIFVVRKEDDAGDFIWQQAALLHIPRLQIVALDHTTDGQATSAMHAQPYWWEDAPLLIYNIDTFVHPDSLQAADRSADGWIPCFQAQGDHWSFAEVDSGNRVISVQEKKRISPHATIGLYWFKTAGLYSDAYHRYYEQAVPRHTLPERYIAPLYNQMIADGRKITIADIPLHAVHPLGTPEELQTFLQHPAPL